MMFNSTSTAQPGDSIISYEWNFGDNTFDTIASPIHTYLPGQYTVCLKISSQLGCIDSICQNIVVMPCTLFVSITVDSVNNTMTSFVQGGSPPYTYSWSNGATGPVITGITQGTYCVVVTDGNGCTGSACANFNSTNCNAIFYPQYNCNGGSITFIISVMGVYDSLDRKSTRLNSSHRT